VDTALHIVKGAIVKVLHTPITVGTNCASPDQGKITVEYAGPEKPADSIIQKIQQLANEKIQENVDVIVTSMGREEAEEKYKKNLVNETFIYDKFPVPAEVKTVNVLEIKDW
jgi:Ser-tRNA(Ala) deacylase AlaX